MAKKKIRIRFEQWDHTCGDGCCYTWGEDVFINDELVTTFNDYVAKQPLIDILEHLGYEVEEQ